MPKKLFQLLKLSICLVGVHTFLGTTALYALDHQVCADKRVQCENCCNNSWATILRGDNLADCVQRCQKDFYPKCLENKPLTGGKEDYENCPAR